MTPSARLQASIELAEFIAADPGPADRAVADYLRRRRYIGAKDRRQLTQMVYDRMRRQARLDWWLARAGLPAAPRSRALADLLLSERLEIGAVEALFDAARFAPAALDRGEARALRLLRGKRLENAGQPPEVAGECPAWLLPHLPEATAALLASLSRPAPLDLRVNLLKATPAGAKAVLEAEGIACAATAFSPIGLRVGGRRNVAATGAFKAGLVERQDEGSQLAALLVDAQPGERVVDFCAGAGGKTLALAAAMGNKGNLYALDVSKLRLDRAGRRLRRAGAFNVTRRTLTGRCDPWVKRHKAGFHRVLVDVPCSGVGAWRRNPDARWRLQPEELKRLVALQRAILGSAARLVKPGGRLVYVTCSLLPEENQVQVARFLEEIEGFAQLDARALLPACAAGVDAAGGLTLRPDVFATDGFYVAVLQRRA
ncbi:MAG: RsmB/NOP family class I SAM-dependent RNA methyltransferase [Rhodospirillales bacterium]|nr:RsmB/NOP family class I SAM-dependent RNA methyltransferase [Rhodospirillales bacterium]